MEKYLRYAGPPKSFCPPGCGTVGALIGGPVLFIMSPHYQAKLDKYLAVLPYHLKVPFEMMIHQVERERAKYNPKTKKYHWNYKGGITPENKAIRNSEKMKIWRQDVFTRDGYTCQKYGIVGGILNAHHIKPFASFPELRFDVNNGMTLCKVCHIKIHKKNGE